MPDKVVSLFRNSRGEIASLLTLITAGLILLGVAAGSFLAQNQNDLRSRAQDTPIVEGNCDAANNPWICEIGSWKNCLDNKPGHQSLFTDTYCDGEKMWRWQAAKAHGGNGIECGGTEQALKTTGCGQNSPTPVSDNIGSKVSFENSKTRCFHLGLDIQPETQADKSVKFTTWVKIFSDGKDGHIQLFKDGGWLAMNGWNKNVNNPFMYEPQYTASPVVGVNSTQTVTYSVKIDECNDLGNTDDIKCNLSVDGNGKASNVQCNRNLNIAPTSPPNLTPGPTGNINGFCLGGGGASKVATSYCLQWGQSSPYGGVGKSSGPHYCCDECDPGQAGVWSNTCFRPNSQNSNYQGPCKSDAGVSFPLACALDPNDNKWKWVSQNHYGECNSTCSVSGSQTVAASTPTPRTGGPPPVNTPTPTASAIANTPTTTPTTTPDDSLVNVWIYNSSFQPKVFRIKLNSTVVWKNIEPIGHTVSSNSNVFDSGLIPYNGKYQFKFTSSGNYDYYSKMSPQMTGTIVVEDPNAPPTPTLKPGEPTLTPIPTFIPPVVTIIPSPTPKSSNKVCEPLEVNGNQNDNEDIIIMGDHYEKVEDLIADGKRVVESVHQTNLGQRIGKLNFYVYTVLADFGVQNDGNYNYDMALTGKKACNGDTSLLLTKKFDNTSGNKSWLGSSWAGLSSLNYDLGTGRVTGGKEAIVVAGDLYADRHELAHAVAGAADEYTYMMLVPGTSDQFAPIKNETIYKDTPSYNCSNQSNGQSQSRCDEWKNKYGDTLCIPSCGYSNWFKPSSSSDNVMMGSKYYNKTNPGDHPKYQEFDKPTLELWDIALHFK